MTRRLPFQLLLYRDVGVGVTLFLRFLHFTLDPYLIMQGGINYQFWVFEITRPRIEPRSPGRLYTLSQLSNPHCFKSKRPVGVGCRIRWLHLCKGVRTPTSTNEATCWPWVATHKVLGRNPGGWVVIDPTTEWSMACNTSLWPLLGLTGGRIGPDPINRLVPTCLSTYVFFFRSYHTICSRGTIRSTFA